MACPAHVADLCCTPEALHLLNQSISQSMDVNMDLTMDLQIYKTGMITVLSNYLIQQHNANRLTSHITMKVVSEDSCYSMAGWGTLVACAEVYAGSVEDWNAKHGQQLCTEEY
jgi:hypothetical protein